MRLFNAHQGIKLIEKLNEASKTDKTVYVIRTALIVILWERKEKKKLQHKTLWMSFYLNKVYSKWIQFSNVNVTKADTCDAQCNIKNCVVFWIVEFGKNEKAGDRRIFRVFVCVFLFLQTKSVWISELNTIILTIGQYNIVNKPNFRFRHFAHQWNLHEFVVCVCFFL